MPLDETDLDPDPLHQLASWIAEAEHAGHRQPTAFALATADADGRPAVRYVLVRDVTADGLRFYTNRESAKGLDLAVNPRAAAAFWWERTNRQVRLSGRVTTVDEAETAAYWATRPRGHQLAAWASAQSQPIPGRAKLESRMEAMAARFGPDQPIPLPPFWGGFRLEPDVVEFWESREDRLHDRIECRRSADGTWVRRRLQP